MGFSDKKGKEYSVMTMILGEKTVREIIYLLGFACVLAFAVNFCSPSGIALKGSWDIERGVITADPDNGVVVHEIEINSVAEAKKLYDQGDVLFVDARHTDMFNLGFIKGAVPFSIYEYDEQIDNFALKYSSEQKIITYCSGRECDESHELATFLKAEGYTNVRVFIDGFPAWENEGYPVERN